MKNNKRFIFIIILAIILGSIIPALPIYGEELGLPNQSHELYVYEELEVLENSTKEYIINTNKELYNKTGAQVVVAIMDGLNGSDINSYAVKLFEKWEIGSKGKDNGILVLLDMEENNIWIEVGYGLEGALPDARTKNIIEKDIIPNFKNGDFNNGILLGFDDILSYIEDEYNIQIDGREDSGIVREDEYSSVKLIISIFILIILFIIIDNTFMGGRMSYIISRSMRRSRYYGGYGGYSGRGSSGRSSGGGSSGGGGRSGGGGAGGSW